MTPIAVGDDREAAACPIEPPRSSRRHAVGIGLLAAALVVLTLDGPGLTVDEPLDVRPGRNYIKFLVQKGRDFFSRAVVDEVFRDNAEHPPMGRWLLGIASVLGEPFEVLLKGTDPTGSYVLAGRLAPALTFGALVGLVVGVACQRWGKSAGLASGIALAMMPRVFAHAHFGALDTFLSFFWTAALLAGERALRSRRPALAMLVAGMVWSLALLTKIQAWFLLPIMGIWTLVRLPLRRAVPIMAGWTIVGIALFWAGWPWLWYNSWARLWAYWGTGVERTTIWVQYFGRVYADRDVPWHYPWVYFTVTVPVGLQVLGVIGTVQGWRRRRQDAFPLLLSGSILLFLILFSTRVPVYDGERLFLHVFPAWSLLIGLGFGWLRDRLSAAHRGQALLIAMFAGQVIGLVTTYPFGLSYYNLVVGGLPGARRLGLELTYWGDAVDQVLLDRLAHDGQPGDPAALAPTLYQGQGVMTTGFNRTLAHRKIILGDDVAAMQAEWLVLSYRTAYWRPQWIQRLKAEGGQLVAERSRQGVRLSGLWHFPRGTADAQAENRGHSRSP